MASFVEYFFNNRVYILELSLQHIYLTLISVFTATIIGVPLGILINFIKSLKKPIMGFANILQSIPSIALLGFLIPFLGIGNVPAIFMTVIYSLLPIIKNTSTGLSNINRDLILSARGIGMTRLQILLRVKLPLALPFIIAGVRISSVTAVGLVTIAAFIGSGGLGHLVYSGIRTLNTSQILAGAIPVCIIALAMDYLLSVIERYVTPIGLQSDAMKFNNKQMKRFKKMKYLNLSIVGLLILLVFSYTFISRVEVNSNIIIIGSKADTETTIIAYMYSHLIERHTDLNVVTMPNLGGTSVVFNSIVHGEIDLYLEYTGTAYTVMLNKTEMKSPDYIFNVVKQELRNKYNLHVLSPIGFNNTYALAVRKDTAQAFNLKTISDLALVSHQLIFSPTFEFMNRDDGFIGLQSSYGLSFKNVIALDGATRYTSLINDQSQVIEVFSTDGLIHNFGLVLLKDDLEFFPPYYAIPVIRNETVLNYPQILPVIDMLTGVIDEEAIIELNYKVDVLNQRPRDVALQFLEDNNLV